MAPLQYQGKLQEKTPKSAFWTRLRVELKSPGVLTNSSWRRGKIVVLSSIDTDKDQLLYHVSVSVREGLPTDEQVRLVRIGFGMEDAEEDNPKSPTIGHPCRHLWKIINNAQETN
jgi:hypothetical protein